MSDLKSFAVLHLAGLFLSAAWLVIGDYFGTDWVKLASSMAIVSVFVSIYSIAAGDVSISDVAGLLGGIATTIVIVHGAMIGHNPVITKSALFLSGSFVGAAFIPDLFSCRFLRRNC